MLHLEFATNVAAAISYQASAISATASTQCEDFKLGLTPFDLSVRNVPNILVVVPSSLSQRGRDESISLEVASRLCDLFALPLELIMRDWSEILEGLKLELKVGRQMTATTLT
jgi:hypothetical protein